MFLCPLDVHSSTVLLRKQVTEAGVCHHVCDSFRTHGSRGMVHRTFAHACSCPRACTCPQLHSGLSIGKASTWPDQAPGSRVLTSNQTHRTRARTRIHNARHSSQRAVRVASQVSPLRALAMAMAGALYTGTGDVVLFTRFEHRICMRTSRRPAYAAQRPAGPATSTPRAAPACSRMQTCAVPAGARSRACRSASLCRVVRMQAYIHRRTSALSTPRHQSPPPPRGHVGSV